MIDSRENLIAAWLGASVFLQAILLGRHLEIGLGSSIQYYAGAACFAVLTAALRRFRTWLNPHVDMVLIMLASGGLGMFAAQPAANHVACSMNSWRAYGWMLLFGLGPAIPLSRCLRAALRHGYLLWALLIDASTMIGGMWLSSRANGGHGDWAVLTRHLTMLGGMTVGMLLVLLCYKH